MSSPGGHRPGNFPPNYNPNALASNIQNLQINQPNQQQSSNIGGYGPRPTTTPFGQPPPPFAGARPGPPPPATVPSGTLPPNVAPQTTTFLSRPIVPPPGSQPSAFALRPPPPGVSPSFIGGPGAQRPLGSTPRPGPFSTGPVTSAPIATPQLSGSSPVTNGPPSISSGAPLAQGFGPRFPTPMGGGTRPLSPGMVAAGGPTPPPPPHTRPSFGSPPSSAASQPAVPPFSVAPPPPPSMGAPSPFPPQVTGGPRLSSSPYGMQTWPPQAQQFGPPPQAPSPMNQQQPVFGMPPGAPQFPNQSTALSQTGQSKIDPDQIPHVSSSSSVILHETRQGNQANPPPPATSEYIVKDTGNCSPRYMRCTINQIPCTVDLLSTSAMQLALLVQPLALPHPSEDPIHVVDFGESGPVRCSRCKGYINPFVKFIDQGRRFICNLCGFTDETPRDYHCNLGPDGRRRDADERPELCRGTVEFIASKEYMVRDPMPAVFFFLIDVSMNAIQTGATAAACSAINQVISDIPAFLDQLGRVSDMDFSGDLITPEWILLPAHHCILHRLDSVVILIEGPRTMVGIATFDSTIHFYNLKRALQQPLMLIVPDVQDVYTPLESDVVVQLSECRQHLEMLLESIPTMFQNNRTADSAFGAATKAAFLAIKSTGGKLLVFQSGLASAGIGSLSAREAEGRSNISAGEKEAHKLLQPADKTLKTMAIEFAEYQVCVDLFLTTQTYVDIASISVIPRTTGGQVYYYYPFSALSDPAKLYNDLRWNVTRPQGFEAVMRVRCSQGIQVQEYSGNFCKRIPTDVDLPAIDCDKTIMVTLKHDDKLQEGTECAFQCALLYTTIYGQRRIRVSNLSLPSTNMLSNLFRSADLDTQFACIMKQAASEVPIFPLSQVRDQTTNVCANILYSYRKFCATVSSSGQLILPEALKLLPLYSLALLKSPGLRSDGRIDDRSFWINYVAPLPTPLIIPLVYPRLIAVHDLDKQDLDDSRIPASIPLSSEHISDEGIYMLENGVDCLIYAGNSVPTHILRDLFGISYVEEISDQFVLQQHDNALSKKLNAVVNEIRRQRCSYLRLKLCKKGDPSGMMFYSYMVEDKSHGGRSYVEHLIYIHRQIQSKMA